MPAIADIVSTASGQAGAWRVERSTFTTAGSTRPVEVATLYHYGTAMLRWQVDNPGCRNALSMGTGHGSVSDQNGMNIAFRILNLPYWFGRAGGAEIVRTNGDNRAPYSRFTRRGGQYRRVTYTYAPA